MCCCASPNVNGQPGYRWQPNDRESTRPPSPPPAQDGDELVYDLPGRCGGIDSHCHHFQVVASRCGGLQLRWRHGGGHGQARFSNEKQIRFALLCLDDTARYWLMQAMFHALNNAAHTAASDERQRWAEAAAEKRIKKSRRGGRVTVYITPRVIPMPVMATEGGQ